MTTLLHKYVDADQWEAENLVGRLGLVTHAAFLHAGFVPYGLVKRPRDVSCSVLISRRYTALELARREGAEVAVLKLCRAMDCHLIILMYIKTERDKRHAYWSEPLFEASDLTPFLTRRMDDVACSVSRFCWSLANASWDLLVELCGRNGLARTGLMSLPDDLIVEILRLARAKRRHRANGKVLATMACMCRRLKRLVAEHDMELWKPLHEAFIGIAMRVVPDCHTQLMVGSSEGVASWKARFVKTLQWHQHYDVLEPTRTARVESGEGQRREVPWHDFDRRRHVFVGTSTGKSADGGHQHGKMPQYHQYDYYDSRKQHGAGAIHSPSSRYRWKHR
ncbi:unnamed protein product [Urochloa humidicola]